VVGAWQSSGGAVIISQEEILYSMPFVNTLLR